MSNNHHDMGKSIREMFPEQTKSIPRILSWTFIFLADVALVFWVMGKLGVDIVSMQYQFRKTLLMLYLLAAFLIFLLETFVYNKFCELFR